MEIPEVKVKILKDGVVLQQDGQEIVMHDDVVDSILFEVSEGLEARDARQAANAG